jgi:hypothetical protein
VRVDHVEVFRALGDRLVLSLHGNRSSEVKREKAEERACERISKQVLDNAAILQ